VLGDPMRVGWLARTTTGRFPADYISTSVFNGGALALPAFSVASQPGPNGTFDQAIYTARVAVRGGDVDATDDAVVSRGHADDADTSLSAELGDADG
jgi:hypothetical protein